MNKLYEVIYPTPYCESGVLGYIEEEYLDGTVKFFKLGSDIEVFLSKDVLQEVQEYE